MNGLEKFALIGKLTNISRALKEDDYAKVAMLLGLTPEIAEDMSMDEIFDAMAVRLSDLMNLAKKELPNE